MIECEKKVGVACFSAVQFLFGILYQARIAQLPLSFGILNGIRIARYKVVPSTDISTGVSVDNFREAPCVYLTECIC